MSFDYLKNNNTNEVFNLGSGKGKSVKEIIKLARQVTNKNFQIKIENKRIGDPAILVANCDKAKKILKWSPQKNIKEIIESAYDWHKKRNRSY